MGFSIQCLWLVTVGVNQSATEFNISSKSGPVSPECFFFFYWNELVLRGATTI